MNNESNTTVLILKRKALYILIIVILIPAIIYFCLQPIKSSYDNYNNQEQLKTQIKEKESELETIKEKNRKQAEANKREATRPFFEIKGNDDIRIAYAPMFENIITMIKQNGIRMKSITYKYEVNDNLVQNGGSSYKGCQVDFVLVGYYEQFANFLNELDTYPYFISLNKFKITPYQYDKRILIGEVSIIFYSKR